MYSGGWTERSITNQDKGESRYQSPWRRGKWLAKTEDGKRGMSLCPCGEVSLQARSKAGGDGG